MDTMNASSSATVTKNKLFERFLSIERHHPNGVTDTPEETLEFCETVLSEQILEMSIENITSDDPEGSLQEIALQLMGCANELRALVKDFRAFSAEQMAEATQ